MPANRKSVKKAMGRNQTGTKPITSAGHEMIGPRQLKRVGKLLGRIERRGETLSATADRLLKRVS